MLLKKNKIMRKVNVYKTNGELVKTYNYNYKIQLCDSKCDLTNLGNGVFVIKTKIIV